MAAGRNVGGVALAALVALAGCAQAPVPAAADLRGTEWKLLELDGAVLPASAVRMTLQADARVGGFGGCNRFSGGYTLDGAALRFTPLAATRMACEPALMDLERRVFDALATVGSYRIEGNRLTLLRGDRVVARWGR